MDNETWLVLSAAVVGAFAAWSAWSAKRSADAAEGHTEQQRQIHEDSAQPYVWASIVPDNAQGTLLHLVISNEGPTVATDIKVEFEPNPVPTAGRNQDEFRGLLSTLASDGISSLPPRRQIKWFFDSGLDFFTGGGTLDSQATVNCNGPYGACQPVTHRVRLEDIKQSLDAPDGSLHRIREQLKEMTKVLKENGRRQPPPPAVRPPTR